MSTVVKDLGAVSAYAYAVEKGYTGTEAEFAELMASYAEVGQTAANAAESALNSKTAAQTAATTATNKANEATTAAQTATTKAGEASQSASNANTAKEEAAMAKTAAETAQGKAEDAQAAAERVAESIPSDYSQLSEDVSDLKEGLNDLSGFSPTWTNGVYLKTNGYTGSYETAQMSDLIGIYNPHFVYRYKISAYLNGFTAIGFYDENQTLIDTVVRDGGQSVYGLVEVDTAEYPAARYVRLSNQIGQDAKIALYKVGETSVRGIDFSLINNVLVGYDQLSFVSKKYGTNLFNKDAEGVTVGKYINLNGTYSTAAYAEVSDYTEVKPNTTYSHRYESYMGNKTAFVVYYDSNKNMISGYEGSNSSGIASFTTPSNCAYVKFNLLISQGANKAENFMLVEGTTLPSTYSSYVAPWYQFDPSIKFDVSQIYNDLNPLYGKKVAFDGDSICASNATDDPQNGWAGRIGSKNNMVYQNFAVGGGTITSDVDSTAHHVVDYLDTIYETMPDLDYYIFDGGTNDADIFSHDDNARLGTVDPTNYTGTYDKTTFCGAFETIMFKTQQYFPHAKIAYIVAPKMGMTTDGYKNYVTVNRKVYFDKAMEICKKWGVPYINLWDGCRMNPELRSQYAPPVDITGGSDVTAETIAYNITNNKLYRDGQHPTAKGYDLLTPMIEAWMKTL